MKKSDKLARKTRKMIAKNLIVLAVLAVVAFAGVVSWFTQNTTATASGVVVKTQVSDGLEFYIMPPSAQDQYADINNRLATNRNSNNGERTTWHTSSDGDVLFDTSSQEFKFMEGLFLCETTSDGYTFNIPKLMQYDEVAYVDTTQSFDPATPNDEYLSFDLYFRSDTTLNNHDVVLQSDSSITANSSFVNTADTYNNASDNPDLKDAAIGAVRMSVYNANTRKVLWIPGPHVYYDGVADTLQTGLTSNQYSNKGPAYYTGSAIALRSGEGTNDHAYYSAPSTRQKIMNNATNMFAGSTLGRDQEVVTLNQFKDTNNDNVPDDGYYYGHIRVNLWIEGEDAEARLAFVGGKFSMALNFGMIINNNNS